MTKRDGAALHLGVLADLLRSQPMTAARNGLFTALDAALQAHGHDDYVEGLALTTAPLRRELGATDVRGIAAGLAALTGKPRRAISREVTSPEMVTELGDALDALGAWELSNVVRGWLATSYTEMTFPALTSEGRAVRHDLAAELLTRCLLFRRVLPAVTGGLRHDEVPAIDGRTMSAAARACKTPLFTGSIPEAPRTLASRHPNRVGRLLAAVAMSRAATALSRSFAADEAVVEPLLLLFVVAECVRPGVPTPDDAALARRGRLLPKVRRGDPEPRSLSSSSSWAVLSNWGSVSRASIEAAPTAWKLPPVWADVLLWALCSAAARTALAADYRKPDARGRGSAAGDAAALPWEEYLAERLPVWEGPMRNAWGFVQSARSPVDRTDWPGCLVPDLSDESTWPWPVEADPWASQEHGMMNAVPATEGSSVL